MKIGEVSKALGISASAIRYYERKGLIKKQPRVSGVREFTADSISTLRFVQLAQNAGFSIDEMKLMLESYNRNSSVTAMWRLLAEKKRQEIQEQVTELNIMTEVLDNILKCECGSLKECLEIALEKGAIYDE